MERKRAETLEALEKFIQAQRVALERTNADIERLKELRNDVLRNPPQTWEEVQGKLDDPAYKLSERQDVLPPLPPALDWSVFAGADPAPFHALAAKARETYAARNVPPKTQLAAPSALRHFVAASRVSVVDPVLNAFRIPDDLAALSSDDEPDPEELRRAREREKIRELKKRRIEGDGGTPIYAGLGLRRPVAAVFVRRDQEDESAEVDISMGDDDGSRTALDADVDVPMAVDTPSASVASSSAALQMLEPTARERRPTRKAQSEIKASTVERAKPTKKGKGQSKRGSESVADTGEVASGGDPARDKKGKAKSETYKQAWSVSEQHLLERLLEEIPDGEKNRWAKISKAMNGRRTARQVASRVQKYYEKLKRFGVEVGSSKAADG